MYNLTRYDHSYDEFMAFTNKLKTNIWNQMMSFFLQKSSLL
jgi:hypothetical protein